MIVGSGMNKKKDGFFEFFFFWLVLKEKKKSSLIGFLPGPTKTEINLCGQKMKSSHSNMSRWMVDICTRKIVRQENEGGSRFSPHLCDLRSSMSSSPPLRVRVFASTGARAACPVACPCLDRGPLGWKESSPTITEDRYLSRIIDVTWGDRWGRRIALFTPLGTSLPQIGSTKTENQEVKGNL